MTRAFANDPTLRWMFPDDSTYESDFSTFAHAFGRPAFENGTAFFTDDYIGAAFWFAPGVSDDEEAVIASLTQSVPADRLDAAFKIFSQMEEFHPRFLHWYLPLIGVDPIHQGNGHGSRLLRNTLDECDRSGIPAYLESSSPENIPLYERHGFRLLSEIQAGNSPTVYPMLRLSEKQ